KYKYAICMYLFFFSSRRRHTIFSRDWSSDVCSSDLMNLAFALGVIDQREGHVAIVIELRVARRLCMREHLHRTQETVADFLRRHAVEGALQCRFVFGADRPQQHAAAIRQLERRFQFARIGPYAQATAGLAMEIGRASCRER